MEQGLALELLIATRNRGKIREIQQMLSGLRVRLRTLDEFPEIIPVEEVGISYKQNASLKALGYARQTGACALADDSGLEVDALGGSPGVFSARFGGEDLSDSDRTEKLLMALAHSDSQRAARFVCVMALAGWFVDDPPGSEPQVLNLTEGICEGSIAKHARGNNGFGFDPVFIPQGHDQTFAELPGQVKSVISHRAKALAKMRLFISKLPAKLDHAVRRP